MCSSARASPPSIFPRARAVFSAARRPSCAARSDSIWRPGCWAADGRLMAPFELSRRDVLAGTGAVALASAARAAPAIAPTWQSLAASYRVPDWFRDAKFGIWAHWGPQCQPEWGDWYARL